MKEIEEEKINPVSIVTIKEKIDIFKGEEKAENIELILLEENGFTLISQKDLYQVGDKAVYIQPDYCLSDISLFEGFLRPLNKDGIPDESKSMLGKVGGLPRRIRAKKFNFHRGDGEVIYSNGILLPYEDVQLYLFFDKDGNKTTQRVLEQEELDILLDITKYEEPESNKGGINTGSSRAFPEGLYKTDESNVNNMWNHIENRIGYPLILIGNEKIDGSSVTIGVKNGEGFICSRNFLKPIKVKKTVGRRKKTFLETIIFWSKPDLNIYEEKDNDDDFVKYGKPYLDLLLANNQFKNIVLRGELNGATLKGSGNKNNPSKSLPANIKFFGADSLSEEKGIFEKVDYDSFKKITNSLGVETVKEVFNQEFNSREEIEKACNNYFKTNMIEGIVLRTPDSKLSVKLMNLEYDSKK